MTGINKEKKRDAARTRKSIIESSAKLFAAKGFEATSLRDIAAMSGIRAATIYHYFKDKKAIQFELFEKYYAELADLYEQIYSTLPPGFGFTDTVSYFLRHHRHFVKKNADVVFFFFMEALRPDTPINKALPSITKKSGKWLKSIASRHADMPREKALLILAAVIGMNTFLQTAESYLQTNLGLKWKAGKQVEILTDFLNTERTLGEGKGKHGK
jgi:AcrR family transcriptional regulator